MPSPWASAPSGAASAAEAWDGRESPTDLELINLSASLNNSGQNPLPHHVHKVNIHSALPADLFKRHQPHGRGTGHGKDDTCYFYDQAPPIISNKGVVKRKREIAGSGKWHQENCKPIHGEDGSVVGLKRRFSYQNTGSEPTGWILFEFSPVKKKQEEDDGTAEMVLCTIHKSKCKKHRGASAADSSSAGAETPRESSLGSPRVGMQSPAMPMPALGIALTDTTDLLQQGAEDIIERGLGLFDRSTVPDASHENRFVVPNSNSGSSSSSGVKGKTNHEHSEAPPSARRGMTDMDRRVLQEVEQMLLYDDNSMTTGADIRDTYNIFKDILNDVDGVSARSDASMEGIAEEYLQEPIGFDNFVPIIGLNDAGDDLDWLMDYPIEDVEIE